MTDGQVKVNESDSGQDQYYPCKLLLKLFFKVNTCICFASTDTTFVKDWSIAFQRNETATLIGPDQ